MMKNGKTVPFLDVFHFPAEKMRDENGNWTIAKGRHRRVGEKF